MQNSVSTINGASGDIDFKAIVRDLLDEMPDDCTLEEIMLELYIRASILESRQQISAGEGLTLEAARKDLEKWLTSRSLQNSSRS